MPKTPKIKFINAPDVHLPLDFKLVAIRPLIDVPRFSIVLAFSEGKQEFATWKYDHDFAGCDTGNYFGVSRHKDAFQQANNDFMIRNTVAPAGGGLYVLTDKQVATISEGLKQDVISREDENKHTRDEELIDSNDEAIRSARRLYSDLNGGEEMVA